MTATTPAVGPDAPPPSDTRTLHQHRMNTDPVYRRQYHEALARTEIGIDEKSGASMLPLTDTRDLAVGNPDALLDQLTARLEAGVEAMRHARGPVVDAADIAPAVRAVHAVREHADRLRHVFTMIAKRGDQILAEELVEAVGERDGIPREQLTVMLADGTSVKLAPSFETVRTHDLLPALQGVSALVDVEWWQKGIDPGADPAGFAIEVARRAIDGLLQKPKVSVTGLAELIRELGAHQLDAVAAVTRRAETSKTSKYKGVKPETIQPTKPTAAGKK